MRLLLFSLAVCLAPACFAAPPDGVVIDPVLHEWFKSLLRPGGLLPCCSVSDCRFVRFQIRDGYYEVEIDGYRYAVPREAIVGGIPNPTGKAVACYTFSTFRRPSPADQIDTDPQDVAKILCFVPPRPPS